MKLFFERIIGIDQTGAIDAKGRFRPLYSVILTLDKKGKVLSHVCERLPRLDMNLWREQNIKTLVLIDSVFGLPKEMYKANETIRDLFNLTRNLSQFGMKGSEIFFANLYYERTGNLLADRALPSEFRECDKMHGAQSLFRSKPFQRNIQTGTLRIWHELSQQILGDVVIWPFDSVQKNSKLVIAEGYPAIFKNQILPKDDISFNNPNFRDAGRLAWGALDQMMINSKFLADLNSVEGAIFPAMPN